jgi:hypothetical protein
MNSSEYDKLSDDEKRIKVAELQGWTSIRKQSQNRFYPDGYAEHLDVWVGKGPYGEDDVPDYLTDLNAMHEAFLSKIDEIPVYYWEILGKVCNWKGEGKDIRLWSCVVHTATAAQRAKAFVLTKTLGD